MIEGKRYGRLMVIAATLTAGCMDGRQAGGTGIGNPAKGSVTVAMQAASSQDGLAKIASPRNPDGSFTILDAGGSRITVQTAFANVGRIRLKLPDGLDCGDADETACEAAEVVVPGPIIADLMTGKWQPDPGTIRIPVGAYRRIEVRLDGKSKDKPGPDSGLDGHSLMIKGHFAHAGNPEMPLRILLDFDEDVEFTSDPGLSVESMELNRFIIFLDVEKWLAGVDLVGCIEDGKLVSDADGGISISKDNTCGQLQADVKAGIKASGSLGKSR